MRIWVTTGRRRCCCNWVSRHARSIFSSTATAACPMPISTGCGNRNRGRAKRARILRSKASRSASAWSPTGNNSAGRICASLRPEKGLTVSCANERANVDLLRTQAPQRVARGRVVRRRGVGVRAGAFAVQSGARIARLGNSVVPDCRGCRLSILDRVRVVLRIHAAGIEARERNRAGRFGRAFDRPQAGQVDHRRSGARGGAAADRSIHLAQGSGRNHGQVHRGAAAQQRKRRKGPAEFRSEEHTSELQSLAYLVCRLLLEKKKQTISIVLLYTKKKKKTNI